MIRANVALKFPKLWNRLGSRLGWCLGRGGLGEGGLGEGGLAGVGLGIGLALAGVGSCPLECGTALIVSAFGSGLVGSGGRVSLDSKLG